MNQVRLHKKLCLPLELVVTTGRSRTDAFDTKNGRSQLKWNFDFPKVEELGLKLMKTCRFQIDEGTYEHYERKDDSENYFGTVETNEMVECKDILGRHFKSGVFKIISMLGVKVELSTEKVEQPFYMKVQELLKARTVKVACDASVKMACWEHGGS